MVGLIKIIYAIIELILCLLFVPNCIFDAEDTENSVICSVFKKIKPLFLGKNIFGKMLGIVIVFLFMLLPIVIALLYDFLFRIAALAIRIYELGERR